MLLKSLLPKDDGVIHGTHRRSFSSSPRPAAYRWGPLIGMSTVTSHIQRRLLPSAGVDAVLVVRLGAHDASGALSRSTSRTVQGPRIDHMVRTLPSACALPADEHQPKARMMDDVVGRRWRDEVRMGRAVRHRLCKYYHSLMHRFRVLAPCVIMVVIRDVVGA